MKTRSSVIAVAVAAFLAVSKAAAAETILDEATYKLALPDPWQVTRTGDAIELTGPDGVKATLGSVPTDPAGLTDSDANAKRGQALQRALAAEDQRLAKARLKVTAPWRVSGLPDGTLLREIVATSADESSFQASAIVSGRTGLVVLSVSGPKAALRRYHEARAALAAISWK